MKSRLLAVLDLLLVVDGEDVIEARVSIVRSESEGLGLRFSGLKNPLLLVVAFSSS